MKRGQLTNHGWIVTVWRANNPPPSGPHEALVLCVTSASEWLWVKESQVQIVGAPGSVPLLVEPRGCRTELIKLLAPYGGNTWVARQAGVTKAYVVHVLGNRLWPKPAEVARRKAQGWPDDQIMRHYGISKGILRRALLTAERGHSVYNGKRVPKRPQYAR